MQHPTEPLVALDATTGWRCRRPRQDQAIVEPLVIPFVVVVRDELADGATPRALADQDHALEAGFLDGAPEARRVGVQVRRAGGALDGGDIGRGERVAHGRPEERVAVMDEDPDVSQASVLGSGGVPHELGDPRPVAALVHESKLARHGPNHRCFIDRRRRKLGGPYRSSHSAYCTRAARRPFSHRVSWLEDHRR